MLWQKTERKEVQGHWQAFPVGGCAHLLEVAYRISCFVYGLQASGEVLRAPAAMLRRAFGREVLSNAIVVVEPRLRDFYFIDMATTASTKTLEETLPIKTARIHRIWTGTEVDGVVASRLEGKTANFLPVGSDYKP